MTARRLSANGKPYRLRLPGPTESPKRVLDATAQPVLNHRGQEFSKILSEVNSMLQPVLGTNNDILVQASSGTGAMEAALANALVDRDRILVLNNGQWGERFLAIATSLHRNITIDTIDVAWGENVDADAVREKMQQNDYAAVIAVHNESSTGTRADLQAIGSIVRESDALLIVDSVSGAGGLELQQDAWGVDILITASQKALMCPPGLGILSISEKAWAKIESDVERARFYFDLRKAKKWAPEGQTAFTTPVNMVEGLHEALTMIHEEGLKDVITRHGALSKKLRDGCLDIGLTSFPTSSMISDTVVVLNVPDGMDGSAIVKHLYTEYGTVIAGSRNKLSGKIIRIGTMGAITADDIETDLEHLRATMKRLRG